MADLILDVRGDAVVALDPMALDPAAVARWAYDAPTIALCAHAYIRRWPNRGVDTWELRVAGNRHTFTLVGTFSTREEALVAMAMHVKGLPAEGEANG